MTAVMPMKAHALDDVSKLRLPIIGSPKVDGYRCLLVDGMAMSSNGKPIRNAHVQKVLGRKSLSGLDGELTVGPPHTDPTVEGTVLQRTSGITKAQGEPAVTLWVFDRHDKPTRPYQWRLGSAEDVVDDHRKSPVRLLAWELLETHQACLAYEQKVLEAGFEGVVFRDPNAPYKNGRSSPTEGWAWKLKRFTDGEATVVSVEEGQVNNNEAVTDELGRTKRSQKAAGMVGSGMAGVLLCKDLKTGVPCRIMPGHASHGTRRGWLERPDLIVGRVIHWRSFQYGVVEKDRFQLFVAMRGDA